MMNGTKKSDSSIVPAKPANKAERSTAELVEGDDGTKRNAELQSTVRTQSREAVTQAQARIRGAVTRNEKEIRGSPRTCTSWGSSDTSKPALGEPTRICCDFDALPEMVVIDAEAETTLAGEHLLNENGCLEIGKEFTLGGGNRRGRSPVLAHRQTIYQRRDGLNQLLHLCVLGIS
jgi:hypothetical protein